MRALATILVLLLVIATAALAFEQASSEGAELSTVAATGSFSFADSREGEPIFAADDLAPGHSARGTVEIANTGTIPGEIALAQRDLSDNPGAGGALLSAQLALLVRDVTVPAAPVTVYSGPLASMPLQSAGRIEPGETHRYEFVATLPDGFADANDLQGASAEVSYSWTANEASANPEGPASPAPSVEAPPLSLEVRRVGRLVHHGRLTVLARCDRACLISVRGHLRARAGAARRGTKLRASGRMAPVVGVQRLRVRVPRPLLGWMRRHHGLRLRARLLLHARDASGQTAAARRVARLRLR